jgi:periplasmic nitrate reductase NapD
MNLSSLIVDVRPPSLPSVRLALLDYPGVEVHAATPEGKLIVTVETEDDAATTETFARINALAGVMSVAMVYHQFEPEPEKEIPHGIDAT